MPQASRRLVLVVVVAAALVALSLAMDPSFEDTSNASPPAESPVPLQEDHFDEVTLENAASSDGPDDLVANMQGLSPPGEDVLPETQMTAEYTVSMPGPAVGMAQFARTHTAPSQMYSSAAFSHAEIGDSSQQQQQDPTAGPNMLLPANLPPNLQGLMQYTDPKYGIFSPEDATQDSEKAPAASNMQSHAELGPVNETSPSAGAPASPASANKAAFISSVLQNVESIVQQTASMGPPSPIPLDNEEVIRLMPPGSPDYTKATPAELALHQQIQTMATQQAALHSLQLQPADRNSTAVHSQTSVESAAAAIQRSTFSPAQPGYMLPSSGGEKVAPILPPVSSPSPDQMMMAPSTPQPSNEIVAKAATTQSGTGKKGLLSALSILGGLFATKPKPIKVKCWACFATMLSLKNFVGWNTFKKSVVFIMHEWRSVCRALTLDYQDVCIELYKTKKDKVLAWLNTTPAKQFVNKICGDTLEYCEKGEILRMRKGGFCYKGGFMGDQDVRDCYISDWKPGNPCCPCSPFGTENYTKCCDCKYPYYYYAHRLFYDNPNVWIPWKGADYFKQMCCPCGPRGTDNYYLCCKCSVPFAFFLDVSDEANSTSVQPEFFFPFKKDPHEMLYIANHTDPLLTHTTPLDPATRLYAMDLSPPLAALQPSLNITDTILDLALSVPVE